MTCIVGTTRRGELWIGADSASVAGYNLTRRADGKVFQNGNFLIGFTTSFRMGQLLQYRLLPPECKPDQDLYRFMVTDFIDAVRQCLKEGGYATKDKETESGGTFLVGYRNRLFTVEDDYQVNESTDPFAAVGAGASFALGALYSTVGKGIDNDLYLSDALDTAEHFSGAVRRPFTFRKWEPVPMSEKDLEKPEPVLTEDNPRDPWSKTEPQ